MKTMKNFAAQQLSKKQMNTIHGGQGIVECAGLAYTVECPYTDQNGVERKVYGCANEVLMALGNAQTEADLHGGKINAHDCIVG